MNLEPGWLERQMENVRRNVEEWPDWMRKATGFEEKKWPEERPVEENT